MKTVEGLNNLGDALRRSGYETHADKLRRLMGTAIGRRGDPGAGLEMPSLKRFEALLLNQDDAELDFGEGGQSQVETHEVAESKIGDQRAVETQN